MLVMGWDRLNPV